MEVGSEAVAGTWLSSGVDIAALPDGGWVRLSVSVQRTIGKADTYSYFVDGEAQATLQL